MTMKEVDEMGKDLDVLDAAIKENLRAVADLQREIDNYKSARLLEKVAYETGYEEGVRAVREREKQRRLALFSHRYSR